MPHLLVSPVLRFLRHLAVPGEVGEASDALLLERFADRRDEAAFVAILRRYGGLVLGVCRRVLPDEHDAEDAFQATFLVLARKAGRVAKREALSCWLHGVAYRVSVKARSGASRIPR